MKITDFRKVSKTKWKYTNDVLCVSIIMRKDSSFVWTASTLRTYFHSTFNVDKSQRTFIYFHEAAIQAMNFVNISMGLRVRFFDCEVKL